MKTAHLTLIAALCILPLASCAHEHHDDHRDAVIVDENHYEHHGYYDENHGWHGGFYDEHHDFHQDPGDWHHG